MTQLENVVEKRILEIGSHQKAKEIYLILWDYGFEELCPGASLKVPDVELSISGKVLIDTRRHQVLYYFNANEEDNSGNLLLFSYFETGAKMASEIIAAFEASVERCVI